MILPVFYIHYRGILLFDLSITYLHNEVGAIEIRTPLIGIAFLLGVILV